MTDQNKSKLIVGFAFIFVAFLCAVAVLFVMGQSQSKSTEKNSSLEVQLANLIAEKSEGELSSYDRERTKRDPLNTEDVMDRSYGREEMERKEGVLWIDRKASTCLVTLGVANGLKRGSLLTIYDDETPVAEVSVESPHIVISYVKPLDKSLSDFNKDYYRVVKKEKEG